MTKLDKEKMERMGVDEKALTTCLGVASEVTREVVAEHMSTGAHHLRILYSRAPNTDKATALQLVMDKRFNERMREELDLDAYEVSALRKNVMPAYTKAVSKQVKGRTEVLEQLVDGWVPSRSRVVDREAHADRPIDPSANHPFSFPPICTLRTKRRMQDR